MSPKAKPGTLGGGRRLVLVLALVTVACAEGCRNDDAGARREAGGAIANGVDDTVDSATAPDPTTTLLPAPPPADVVPEAPLEDTEWRLVALPGAADPPSEARATLVLEREGGLLRGSTGCNGFGGSWEIAGTRIMLGLGDVGVRGCGPDLARLEADYLEALRRTGSYRLRGDTLELLGAEGVVARFEAP